MQSDQCNDAKVLLERYLARRPVGKLKWLKQRTLWKQDAERESVKRYEAAPHFPRLPSCKSDATDEHRAPTLLSSLHPSCSPYGDASHLKHQPAKGHRPQHQQAPRQESATSVFTRLSAPKKLLVPQLPQEFKQRKKPVVPIDPRFYDRLATPNRKTQETPRTETRPRTTPAPAGFFERLAAKPRASTQPPVPRKYKMKVLDPLELERLAQPKYRVVWKKRQTPYRKDQIEDDKEAQHGDDNELKRPLPNIRFQKQGSPNREQSPFDSSENSTPREISGTS